METHKVLLIGSGGREHAIAWGLAKSPLLDALFIAPGNPGTAQFGTNVDLDVDDHDAVLEFCEENGITLVVIGPEKPLVDGLTDYLEDYGYAVFGPSKAAARLEGSKSYSKTIMQKYEIPTAGYHVFERHEVSNIRDFISEMAIFPVVLKVDGLAAGKGVFICDSAEEADGVLDTILNDVSLSAAADFFVLEEFMQGEEVSVFAVSDGKTAKLIGYAQDHKRIGNQDTGLNTGGMGAYAPAPILDEAALQHIFETIIQPTIDAMAAESTPYKGILYTGLMMTAAGPKVVEYNCRFGDPECQVIVPALEQDLLEMMLMSVNERLEYASFTTKPGFFCSVVMASKGYPGSYSKGFPINGLGLVDADVLVFQSGTADKDGDIVTNGGRVLNVVGYGETLKQAIDSAYSSVEKIHFDGAYYRTDIGMKGLRRVDSSIS
jgi:phosphoribosylamine--glycine ligase